MFHFYTPRKYQKIKDFLIFSGAIEREDWPDKEYLMAVSLLIHFIPLFPFELFDVFRGNQREHGEEMG